MFNLYSTDVAGWVASSPIIIANIITLIVACMGFYLTINTVKFLLKNTINSINRSLSVGYVQKL